MFLTYMEITTEKIFFHLKKKNQWLNVKYLPNIRIYVKYHDEMSDMVIGSIIRIEIMN